MELQRVGHDLVTKQQQQCGFVSGYVYSNMIGMVPVLQKISREEKVQTSGQKAVTFTNWLGGLLTEKREAILDDNNEPFAKRGSSPSH